MEIQRVIQITSFQRGFIVYDAVLNIQKVLPNFFSTKKLWDNLVISYDKFQELVIKHDRKKHISVCITGYVLDTKHYTYDASVVAEHIMALCNNETTLLGNYQFLDYLDYLNGRYVLILHTESDTYVFNDACGMRSVFFHNRTKIIASHYNLIADALGLKVSDFYTEYLDYKKSRKDDKPWCLPGNLTPYDDIRQLICNHALSLDDLKLSRFWPRQKDERKVFNIEKSYKYIAETAEKTLELVVNKYRNVFLGLTMGNDSRMSLAASKNFRNKIKYFTYAPLNVVENSSNALKYEQLDAKYNYLFSEKIAKKYSLNFSYIDCTNNVTESEGSILLKNHYHQHIQGIISGFRKKFPLLDPYQSVHIRTNMTELIRRRKTCPEIPKNSTRDTIVKSMAEWSSYNKSSNHPIYKKVLEIYNKYLDDSDFCNIDDYGFGELFYLEYRLNQWHSAVLVNQDSIFDTVILFNTRKILEMGMNVPRSWRQQNLIVTELQRLLWPELLELPAPNYLELNGELVNWSERFCEGLVPFTRNVAEFSNFEIFSGNKNDSKREVNFKSIPHFYGITFGYANSEIKLGDFIELSTEVHMNANAYYYIDVTLLCFWDLFVKGSQIFYEVLLDDNDIFRLSSNAFSRPNQIMFVYRPLESKQIKLRIRLVAEKNVDFKYGNCLIDVKSVIIKRLYGVKTRSDDIIVSSTYQQYQNLVTKISS